MSESLNSIARLGPIRSFIKSSTIKKEIQGHRQRLQDSNQRFNVCEGNLVENPFSEFQHSRQLR